MSARSIGDHPSVQALLRDQLGEGHGVETAVHPPDEMYAYCRRAAAGSPALGAVEYFRTGLLAAQTFAQVLAWRFGG